MWLNSIKNKRNTPIYTTTCNENGNLLKLSLTYKKAPAKTDIKKMFILVWKLMSLKLTRDFQIILQTVSDGKRYYSDGIFKC